MGIIKEHPIAKKRK